MHIIVNRNDLVKALGRVCRVVDRRHTAQILSNILLTSCDNKLVLTATDLEIQIVETLGAQSLSEGKITLPSSLLYDIARRLPGNIDKVELRSGVDGAIELLGGKLKYDLKSLDPEKFPILPDEEDHNYIFSLASITFKRLINPVAQAMSNEETRMAFNGIELRIRKDDNGELLKFAATDAHRLAVSKMTAPANLSLMPNIIIPRKTVYELQKMLGEDLCEEILISLSSTQINFDFGKVILSSKLHNGRFPEYEKIIPNDNKNILVVDRSEFMALVSSVSVIGNNNNQALIFKISDNNLILTMESSNSERSEVEINCQYSGDALEVGFNPKYILDGIGQFSHDDLIFELGDKETACIVKDGPDSDILYLLMPMRY